MLPTARHHCDISSKEAALFGRNDAEMGPVNSLHASAYYIEYNERFDLNVYGQVGRVATALACRLNFRPVRTDWISVASGLFPEQICSSPLWNQSTICLPVLA